MPADAAVFVYDHDHVGTQPLNSRSRRCAGMVSGTKWAGRAILRNRISGFTRWARMRSLRWRMPMTLSRLSL